MVTMKEVGDPVWTIMSSWSDYRLVKTMITGLCPGESSGLWYWIYLNGHFQKVPAIQLFESKKALIEHLSNLEVDITGNAKMALFEKKQRDLYLSANTPIGKNTLSKPKLSDK